MDDWIGYKWLEREFGIETVQPFPVISRIGKRRASRVEGANIVETHLKPARPEPTLAGHLTFALKREGVHLEFLARLFQVVPGQTISEWVNREPSGQYARRTGFFYEWLSGEELDFPGVSVGNYVLALPLEDYFTSNRPVNAPRWRVRDNLPGLPSFCPLIRRTAGVRALETYDLRRELDNFEVDFGRDVLLRSAVWLTIKESRASFQIEHEESQTDRIKRFASVMERRCGTSENPLSQEFLEGLQSEILGNRALRTGLRRSPVYIGEPRLTGEVIHFVAPHWDQVGPMLAGLRVFSLRTAGRPSLIRAAAMSFGFVYIHPMADGNGRVSRFLVNDTLRRDGSVPDPIILPISTTITGTSENKIAYDRALEAFSKPFMARYSAACSFGPIVTCEDGVRTNFRFSSYDDAKFAWAFPDLTAQAEYLGEVIRETVETEMRQEAGFLLDLRQTRERVKEVVEAPDVEIDRIIRSVRQNGGMISGKLAKEFPILADSEIGPAVISAISGDTDADPPNKN